MEGTSVVTADTLRLNISSSISQKSVYHERRFQKIITIDGLKNKLELITGIPASCMELEIYSEDNRLVCKLSEDDALLGSFHIEDNMRLHVTDLEKSRSLGEYEDVSKVKKFELSDQEYSQKRDSVRAFLKKQKMGKYDPEEQKRMKQKEEERAKIEKEALENITVGSRCLVEVPNQMQRRGTVRYVGLTDFQPHVWVGVEYDEPMGKHNGSVKGRQYFTCADKYGGFVRPVYVKCGDYPEINDFEDEEDEM